MTARLYVMPKPHDGPASMSFRRAVAIRAFIERLPTPVSAETVHNQRTQLSMASEFADYMQPGRRSVPDALIGICLDFASATKKLGNAAEYAPTLQAMQKLLTRDDFKPTAGYGMQVKALREVSDLLPPARG